MGILYHTTGNIGIGSIFSSASPPAYKLDVAGDIRIGANIVAGGGTVGLEIGANSTYKYLQLLNSGSASGLKCGGLLVSDDYTFASPARNDLVVKGSIGIGVATPTATLDVNGTIKGVTLQLSGKATSQSTVSTDSATTLVTKDYLSSVQLGGSMVMYAARPAISLSIPSAGNVGTCNIMTVADRASTPSNAKSVFGVFEVTSAASGSGVNALYAAKTNSFDIANATAPFQYSAQQSTGYKYNHFTFVELAAVAGASLGFYYWFSNASGFANPSSINFVPFGYIT